eukprot:2109247-Pleurochrysis_carterae.AAC.3
MNLRRGSGKTHRQRGGRGEDAPVQRTLRSIFMLLHTLMHYAHTLGFERTRKDGMSREIADQMQWLGVIYPRAIV